MRTVYLKNFRKGFATNSSSTHSVIYRNKEDLFKDLDIFELNYYDRFDNTIAASKEAKIKYVAANIMWHDKLYEIMSLYYPQMNEYKELIKKTKNLLKKLYDNNLYDILFLGYKTNGRGVTQKHNRLTNEDLTYILEDAYSINVDTTFANTYKDWLQNNFDIKYSITFEEGEYSMYIDGVTENAYKSSYQLDKPYNLTYTTMNLQARNKEWFEVIDAFKNIRKDNGFENIEKE